MPDKHLALVDGNIVEKIPLSAQINVESLTADKTLVPGTDKVYQHLNPNGANRVITLDTASARAGDRFIIRNTVGATSSYYLQIQQGSTILDYIYSQSIKKFIFDGTNWVSNDVGTGVSTDTNVALGNQARAYASGTAIGYQAYADSYGVAMGNQARGMRYGVAIGSYAGFNIDTTADRYNTLVGAYAGYRLTTGVGNIILGYGSGYDAVYSPTTGSYNILIGYNAWTPATATSNFLNIGGLIFGTNLSTTANAISSGNVGIGTTTPSAKLHIAGTASTDVGKFDIGIDLNPVSSPATFNISLVAEAGNVDAGVHYYYVTYYTNVGETGLTSSSPASVTTDSTHGKVLVNLPISSDYRVIGRKIYRTTAGSSYYSNVRLVATIPNNTDTSYIDNIADANLTGTNYYLKENTTTKYITIGGTPFLMAGYGSKEPSTIFGTGAGATIFNGTAQSGANVLIGYNAGRSLTTGMKNTALGYNALYSLQSGSDNQAIGWGALQYLISGSGNTGVGRNAGFYNVNGSSNVFVGYYAGFGVSGTSNYGNVVVGSNAGYSLGNSANNNTLIGYMAGNSISSGAGNITLGYRAGNNITTGSRNIIIGYDINAPSATDSYQLNIGNIIFGTGLTGTGATIAGNVSIGTTAGLAKLAIVSGSATEKGFVIRGAASQTANLLELQNSAGTVLTSFDASGNLQFSGNNIITDTVTGTKIGTASNQKLGFFGATPITQPNTTGQVAGHTAGVGTAVTDASTFTGGVGTTAYTIGDIVKHLKNLGLLAS